MRRSHWDPKFVHYINTFGQDKVIFGTDWPVLGPERAVHEVQELGLRDKPYRKMMRDNAVRLFKLDESSSP